MEKEFVPYELALKLKALGFDEPCFGMYCEGRFHRLYPNSYKDVPEDFYREVDVPTFSQAFRWFREKYRLHTYIEGAYPWFRYYINSEDNTWEGFKHLKYKEAELDCLDKLIEIVEGIESQK